MASVLFSNNASAALASSITTSATTITVTTGAGAQFPAISGGNYFYATLTDSSNNLEIVKVTARASDVLTVVRAQEGTTARAYAAADKLELRVTTAALTEYVTLAINDAISATKQALYPVGSVYTNSSSAVNPATLLGFGTWAVFGAGRTVISQDGSTFIAGATGGSADAITVAHTHTFSATSTAMSANASHNHSASDSGHAHGYQHIGTNGPYYQTTIGTGSYDQSLGNYTTATGNANISVGNTNTDHTHNVSGTTSSTGASGTGANLPPYVVVYMWQRTA
jgi:hypothetical protein